MSSRTWKSKSKEKPKEFLSKKDREKFLLLGSRWLRYLRHSKLRVRYLSLMYSICNRSGLQENGIEEPRKHSI